MERLRQETLDLTGTEYHLFILIGQFFHTKNSDDILQFFVLLQIFLYLTGYLIMLLAYHIRLQNTGV